MKKARASELGFTLMEMLIVVTIIGILAAIVLPRILTSSSLTRKAAHRQERTTINSQLESYNFLYEQYPSGMTNASWNEPGTSTGYKDFFPDGVPTTCNQTASWAIDTGRIQTSGHPNHE
jgi:general secretion pathway protein G